MHSRRYWAKRDVSCRSRIADLLPETVSRLRGQLGFGSARSPQLAVLLLVIAPPGYAQTQAFMMNECSSVAQTYFREFSARTDMQYNGQRTDGTHAINGRIFLETRYEDFACSYDRTGQRMFAFFAEGRERNDVLPAGGGDPSGANVVRVVGVPTNDVLNVRSGPGTSYQIVGALANGDLVRRLVCQDQGNSRWCQIEMMTDMRERGWVNDRFLASDTATRPTQPIRSPEVAGTARVSGLQANGILNVRSGPGTSFSIVGALGNGSVVKVLACEGSGPSAWCRIEMMTDMREQGWVSARYLVSGSGAHQSGQPEADAGATTTVRVRFSPGQSGTEITNTLPPGASVRYVLDARANQNLYVRLASDSQMMSWRIFNPDGSLLDQALPDREYRGQLWQFGDHVIEVINRDSRSQTYSAIFGIR